MQIKFICRHCEDINKSRLGIEGFVPLEDEWNFVSDAIQHSINYMTHIIEAVIVK